MHSANVFVFFSQGAGSNNMALMDKIVLVFWFCFLFREKNNENLSSASNAHSEYSRIKWDFFVVFRDIKQVLYDESLERKVSICFIGLLINFLTVWAIITQYHSNVRGISSIAMHLSMIAATAQFLRENISKERLKIIN